MSANSTCSSDSVSTSQTRGRPSSATTRCVPRPAKAMRSDCESTRTRSRRLQSAIDSTGSLGTGCSGGRVVDGSGCERAVGRTRPDPGPTPSPGGEACRIRFPAGAQCPRRSDARALETRQDTLRSSRTPRRRSAPIQGPCRPTSAAPNSSCEGPDLRREGETPSPVQQLQRAEAAARVTLRQPACCAHFVERAVAQRVRPVHELPRVRNRLLSSTLAILEVARPWLAPQPR